MRWNGIVSQHGNMNMKSRLTRAKIHHPTSIARGGYGQPNRGSRCSCGSGGGRNSRAVASARHELIAPTPHRLDHVEAELRAEPPDAHVDHVGPRIEVVAPDGGEQLALGDRVPGVL